MLILASVSFKRTLTDCYFLVSFLTT